MRLIPIFIFLSLLYQKNRDHLIQKFPKAGIQFNLPSEKWEKMFQEPQWRQGADFEWDDYALRGLKDSLNHEMAIRFSVKMEKLKNNISAEEYLKSDTRKYWPKNHPEISFVKLKLIHEDSAVIYQFKTMTVTRGDTTFYWNMRVYAVYKKSGIQFSFGSEKAAWDLVLPDIKKILESLKPIHSMLLPSKRRR